MDTDPVTNMPREVVRKQQKRARSGRVAAKGGALEKDVRTKGGGKVIAVIEKELKDRLLTLMREDEQCKALMNILSTINVNVNMYRQVAKEMADFARI